MPWELLYLPLLLPAFMLVFLRISAMLMSAPIFAAAAVPVRIRIAFGLVLSFMMFPLVVPTLPAKLTLADAVGAIAGELVIGITLGLGIGLIFIGAQLCGFLIGHESGLGIGQVFNPVMETQTTILGQLFFFLALTAFLAIGGLGALVKSLLDSFATMPPMTFTFSERVPEVLLTLLQMAMTVGIRLAAPAMVALFLISIAMGFLAKTIPQLNILTIGFAIRVVVGLVITILSLNGVEDVFVTALDDGFALLRETFAVGRT